MKLILVGPQGSGKGTQAKIISEKLALPHISTGDLFRALTGELKAEVDTIVNSGKLVPDELTVKILKERISKEDCKNGFILDGFPRNISQAKALDSITKVDKIIEISITDDEAVKRIGTRLSCKKCGSVYNLVTNPPKVANTCDKCSSPLIQRADDTEESLRKRLQIYHDETEPILEYYSSTKINGDQSIENVTKDILKELN
jgi:adenylate kinase